MVTGNAPFTFLFPLSDKHLIIAAMPVWVLVLSYWLHLLATVIWIGGLAMLILAAWSNIEGINTAALEALDRRFRPYANISLAILLATGLIQMGGDQHYEGFLKITNGWSIGLLAKHVIIGLMIIVSAILQLSVYPALERARLLATRSLPSDEESAHRRLRQLTSANLALGVLVLLLTAVITAL